MEWFSTLREILARLGTSWCTAFFSQDLQSRLSAKSRVMPTLPTLMMTRAEIEFRSRGVSQSGCDRVWNVPQELITQRTVAMFTGSNKIVVFASVIGLRFQKLARAHRLRPHRLSEAACLRNASRRKRLNICFVSLIGLVGGNDDWHYLVTTFFQNSR
jgi:hypothetical protein